MARQTLVLLPGLLNTRRLFDHQIRRHAKFHLHMYGAGGNKGMDATGASWFDRLTGVTHGVEP